MATNRKALDDLLKDLDDGQVAPVYLFYGDEALVAEAARRVAEHLVPASARDFNLERVDGAAATGADILTRLSTVPFMPGRKVVCVEGTGVFLSRRSAGDVLRRGREAWEAGRRESAARLFLQLLAVAGVTREALRRGEPVAWDATRFEEVFGVAPDEDTAAWVKDLVAHCNASDLGPAAAGDDAARLAVLVEKGLPPRAVLVLTAAAVDRRGRLYRVVETAGRVVDFAIDYGWRDNELPVEVLRELVQSHLGEAGKSATGAALDAIAERAGAGVRALYSELDKLVAYVGNAPQVDVQDVRACFSRGRHAHVFDLTDALGSRDATALVAVLHDLLAEGAGAAPLQMLGTLAGGVRNLIRARGFIDGPLRGRFNAGQPYGRVKAQMTEAAEAMGGMNAYRAYLLLGAATRYRMDELVDALAAVQDTDIALKSSHAARSPVILLEALAFRVCGAVSSTGRTAVAAAP
jgi:DNA polymerase-3 subunit delta